MADWDGILVLVDSLVEMLDRQADFLLKQTDPATFLIQIEPFLRVLESDPRLAAYLDDVRQETFQIIESMEDIDAHLTAELVELRRELVELCPGSDDSNITAPSDSGSRAEKLQARLSYWGTLAYFDVWAASDPAPFTAEGKGGLAQTLLNILRSKDAAYIHERDATTAASNDAVDAASETDPADGEGEEHKPAPDPLEPWRRRLGNVQRRYDYAVRLLRLRLRTSAGLALVRLEAVIDELNPPAPILGDAVHDGDEASSDPMDWMGSEGHSLFKLAWQQRTDAADFAIIDRRVAELRDAAERLHEDLRRRIGVTRSRLALVNRFKLRCEWHDRERMLEVADDDRRPGGPEDRLTREFARYLFDNGLSPLTKPLAGGLEPDLLDPHASFFVEAKQYSASSARTDIIKAVAQVLDTVARLRGGPYAVEEAFCVVFRRDGPYYDLPVALQTATYRLHLVLVDLAPATEAGLRQRHKPVQIPAEDFFADSAVPAATE